METSPDFGNKVNEWEVTLATQNMADLKQTIFQGTGEIQSSSNFITETFAKDSPKETPGGTEWVTQVQTPT